MARLRRKSNKTLSKSFCACPRTGRELTCKCGEEDNGMACVLLTFSTIYIRTSEQTVACNLIFSKTLFWKVKQVTYYADWLKFQCKLLFDGKGKQYKLSRNCDWVVVCVLTVFEWGWDPGAMSEACELSDNGRTVNFHTNYSSGTAVVRGTQPMTDAQYFWEIKMTSPVYGTDMVRLQCNLITLSKHSLSDLCFNWCNVDL